MSTPGILLMRASASSVLMLVVGLGAACGQSTPAPVEVLVSATDYAFDAPDRLPGGRVAFGLENAGRVAHELIVVGLRPGASVAEIVRRDRVAVHGKRALPPSGANPDPSDVLP